jgi:hypothetical protein
VARSILPVPPTAQQLDSDARCERIERWASWQVIVVDLEQLAIKRDRKFLIRLVILLALGVGASVLVLATLTGDDVSGCVARAFLGGGDPRPDPK